MLVPTFVDLQGFIVYKKFIVKEVAVSNRSCASWLSVYHHGLTIRCGQRIKICALQNVFKIYNWWLRKNF
ncbi:hypothetical protein ALC57_07659 [Trachymyrmex cornetzi]|uniref:Uncharacterized protein n=1 Tax=Trachymyrmex cornetzi TaxID=471704 RepID=A0A151J7S9_9HYME|nr:hypothetical protein ALC57_07659 [Trachymyrmex cornetzi]